MIWSSYRKYTKEWTRSGFDQEEMNSEFGKLGNFTILLIIVVAIFSAGTYFLLDVLPSISIDSITGLVIAVAFCFLIALYFLDQKEKSERHCPNCHARAGPNDSYCSKCGTKIDARIQEESTGTFAKI
jgi:hypothetical protein